MGSATTKLNPLCRRRRGQDGCDSRGGAGPHPSRLASVERPL